MKTEGAVQVKVIRASGDTTISPIMRLVNEAQSSRSHYQALSDKATYWLTLIAIAADTITFLTLCV